MTSGSSFGACSVSIDDPVVARAGHDLGHGGAAQADSQKPICARPSARACLKAFAGHLHQWISGSAMGAVPSRKSKSQPWSAWVTWRA